MTAKPSDARTGTATDDETLVEPPISDDLETDIPEAGFQGLQFPARPTRLRPRARRRTPSLRDNPPPFAADGRNKAYLEWLENQSMLRDAKTLGRQLSGRHTMWNSPFAKPDPRAALAKASVWYTGYPISNITKPGQSFLGAMGSETLWEAFAKIGIEAVHTGPVKLAGGISGWQSTPSVDGHFDRISMQIDPLFGTEDEFRAMCESAAEYGGTIIDDIVPGHTGKGADFRLAEMNHLDYPGIYHMVDIPEEAWDLLPEVPEGADAANLSVAQEKALADAGYIIGEMQRVIFFEPGVKETNWSATSQVYDRDGTAHRWVYLHYFKEGQPSINWLDPTFAGMRLVMGDALHSLLDLGSGGLRLDANGFLGVERRDSEEPAWSEGHPLSRAANQLIGSMVRKVGGFTFQELNLTMDDIKSTSDVGPDLSYDFITRPAYQYALATGDTEFLRLVLREAMATGIDQASLVHALQNHDELTYELVHFATIHADDEYTLEGEVWRGADMAEHIRQRMRDTLTGEAAPYNSTFTTNGIACTTTSVITASLGITDLDEIGPDDLQRVISAHILFAMYNAWQPGVFALSGWDLVGALPLERAKVKGLIKAGDTRWIERGAYDLVGWNPQATQSSSAMPRATSLYGTITDQLDDPDSFASRLAKVLEIRKKHGLATGDLVDVPDVDVPGVLVMVNRLEIGAIQLTVLNFSQLGVSTVVRSGHVPVGGTVVNLATRRRVGTVDEAGQFEITLSPLSGVALIVKEPAEKVSNAKDAKDATDQK